MNHYEQVNDAANQTERSKALSTSSKSARLMLDPKRRSSSMLLVGFRDPIGLIDRLIDGRRDNNQRPSPASHRKRKEMWTDCGSYFWSPVLVGTIRGLRSKAVSLRNTCADPRRAYGGSR